MHCPSAFGYEFIATLLLSLKVKALRKSVFIWRSDGQEYSGAVLPARR